MKNMIIMNKIIITIMKSIKILAAMMTVVTVTSSCAVRFDRKKILDKVRESAALTLNGSGNYVTRTVHVADFSRINLVLSGIDAEFMQDDSCFVSVCASDNIQEYISVTSIDGCLYVNFMKDSTGRNYSIMSSEDVQVTVHGPQLKDVAVCGSGDFTCSGLRQPESPMHVSIVGSADADLDGLEAAEVSFEIAGSAEIDCKNVTAGSVALRISGSGSIDIDDMSVREVEAGVSGSGNITLKGNAERSSYSISGSGSIDASELACHETSSNVSGSGSVEYRDGSGRIVESRRK